MSVRAETNFMEQSSCWEYDSRWASQEIPRHVLNPKILYRIHKIPLPVPILCHMNRSKKLSVQAPF
jgi:hypothetical protein